MPFSSKRFRHKYSRRHHRAKRLRLERLEFRRVLATFFVTTTDDNDFGICVPDDQAASIDCSIRSAISAAESNDGPDTVVIPDGTYLLEEGSLDVFGSDDLSLVGNIDAPENVVIDAQGNDRVFDLLSETPISVSFTGLTIQNGVAFDGSGGGGINSGPFTDLVVDRSIIQNNLADVGGFTIQNPTSGGGIQAAGNVTITNSQLLNNEATEHGGAIDFGPFGEDRSLQITDTTIRGNRAAIDGGGIFVESGDIDSNVSIGRSTIEDNEADDSGGGVFILDTDATVFESVFRSNSALGTNQADGVGGGFYIRTESGNESFDIRDTAFEDNRAAGGGGGAIFQNADGTIASTTFQENGVTRLGSGLNLFAQGGGGFVLLGLTRIPSVVADDLTVTDNFAPAGGGLAVTNTDLALTQSTVSGNNASNPQAGGGGIGAISSTPLGMTIEVSDSTIDNNSSEGEGGGIGVIDVDLTLTSVTVQQNLALGGRAGGVGVLGNERLPTTTIQESTIRDNQASTDGGGIYAPGPLTIDQTLIRGNSVDAGSGGGIHLGTGQGSTGSLLVTDSTISGNLAENPSFFVGSGGGVFIESPAVSDLEARFVDTTIDGNRASADGGGISSSGMPLILTRGVVSNNATDQGIESDGGGIFMDGDLTVRETSFLQNSARDFGGAIFYGGGTLDVADNTFSGNRGGDGGGAFYLQSDLDIDATWNNVLFELNEGGEGGAIAAFNFEPATLMMTFAETTFSANIADSGGGAIISEFTEITIRQTTFAENVAGTAGGAVQVINGNAVVENSTFSENTAAGSGGAIFASGSSVGLVHTTFTLNSAQSGGGLLEADSSIEVGNSVIAANSASSSDPDVSGTFISNDGNFIGDIGDASGFNGDLDQVGPGSNGPLDPQLGPLVFQSEPDRTATHAPLPGSPLIDAAGSTVALAIDQRGMIRPIDGDGDSIAIADIGAVEGEEVLAQDPDLELIKSASSDAVITGGSVGFTLDVSNIGSGFASEVTVVDLLPSGLTFVEGSGTGGSFSVVNGTLTIFVGELAPGASQSLQFAADVSASAAGDLVNTASVSALEDESNLDNNESSVTLSVIAIPGNTVQGHLFCDDNGNFEQDPGEQVTGATVFVDLNGNQTLDSEEPFAITDSNGDYMITDAPTGNADIITSVPEGCNTVSPKLASRTTLGVGDLARSIATADIDLNGTTDLVIANDLSSDLTILRNDGDSFSIAQRIPLSERPQSVTVWQPDGELPTYAVAAVGTTESKGKVFLIEPSGMKTIPVGDGPVQVVLDDFNSDGLPDLLTSAFRSSDLHLLLGGTDEPIQLTTGRNVLGAAVGDFDGDGQRDVVVGGAGFGGDTDSEIKVLLGNGDGTFREGPSLVVAKNVVQLTGVDLNGDGTDEILALAKSGRLISLRLQANVTGVDELAVISSTALDPGANAFAVGRFNQDDLLDVAVTNLDRESIEVLVGAGDGRFVSVNTTTNIPSPSDIVIGDFNGDGFGDVAVANLFARGSDSDQGSRYQLPSTATILQFDIASESVFLSGDTVATVDFSFPSANPDLLLDVNGDVQVTPADALAVINALNRSSVAEGEQSWGRFRPDTDVNRDGVTTPLDALLIINHLNRRNRSGEAEAYVPSIEEDPDEARRRRERERAVAVDAVLTQRL